MSSGSICIPPAAPCNQKASFRLNQAHTSFYTILSMLANCVAANNYCQVFSVRPSLSRGSVRTEAAEYNKTQGLHLEAMAA